MKIIKNGGAGSAPGSAEWTPLGVTTSTVGGIPAGTNLGVSAVPIQTTLRAMFYPYVAPSVTLGSSPTQGVYEFGNHQTPIDLTATTVRNSNPITSVIFQRSDNGAAFATIFTVPTPAPSGGPELYSDAPPVPPAVSQVATQRYRSTVGDGTATSNSNILQFTYVYPFYYGVGAPGLTGAQIGALTKIIQTQQNTTRPFSPVVEVYYFAYPASYPNLTSILDPSSFNITADFTLRPSVTITGLDGSPQTYKVYEFNNLTTQTAFNITFNF